MSSFIRHDIMSILLRSRRAKVICVAFLGVRTAFFHFRLGFSAKKLGS